MLKEVKEFLDEYIDYQNVPWQNSKISAVRHAKVRAVQQYLGILPDGRSTPLSVMDYLFYGNPKAKLVASIAQARKDAQKISTVLEELGETELMNRDVALMQFFILEQFSAFKRYVLVHRLFTFSVSSSLPISPSLWVASWAFVLLSTLFYLYWVLMWGISNGSVTLEGWGINFSMALLEDVFAVQGLRCYILFVLSMFSIDPQLRYVYRVLNRVAVSYTQDELDQNLGEIKVVQYLSGACRVARMRISEHLSTGKILRHIDDVDIEVCRLNRNVGMATLAVIVVSIPVFVGMVDFILGEIALDSALPALFSMFLLTNYMIFGFGVIALCIPYFIFGGFYSWRHLIIMTMSRRMKLVKKEVEHGSFFQSRDRWRLTQRGERKITFYAYLCSMALIARRVLLLIAYYMYSPMLIITDALRLFKTEAQLKRELHQRQWRKLNIDQNLHAQIGELGSRRNKVEGLVGRLQLNNQSVSIREGSHFKLDKLRKVLESLPEPIRAMQQIPWTSTWDRPPPSTYLTDCLNRSAFLVTTVAEDDQAVPLPEPDLTGASAVPVNSSMEVKKFREVYTLYSDVEKALNNMLYIYQRLVATGQAKKVRNKYARYLHQIKDYGECDALIHISDYITMIKEVWVLYQPGGVPMDEEEQQEVVNSFSSWMITEGYHAEYEELDVEDAAWWDKYNQMVSDEQTSDDSHFYANFSTFCDWFKGIAANIEQHRSVERRIEEERKLIAVEQARILAEEVEKRIKQKKLDKQNGVAPTERRQSAVSPLKQGLRHKPSMQLPPPAVGSKKRLPVVFEFSDSASDHSKEEDSKSYLDD